MHKNRFYNLEVKCSILGSSIEVGSGHLLGGLLLLLLGALLGCGIALGGSLGSGLLLGGFLFLLLTTTGNEETNHSFGFDETIVIDLEFTEDVINLGLGEFVTEVHQSMTEHLGFDFATLQFVGFEGADDEIVGIVGTTGHLLLEHLDHVVESAATSDLGQHGVKFGLIHELANVVEGSTEITLVNGAVLVDVHEFEALLVHVKLLLGESSLIVTLAHGCCL